MERWGEFVYCELANDAQEFRSDVLKAQDKESLIKLLQKIKNSSFLSHRVHHEKLKDDEFVKLLLDEQKELLFELVDSNMLYINYSDIESKDYSIDYNDKKLNKQFYEA